MTIATHKSRRVQYLATLSVSLATFTLGISAAWPTPVLPKLKHNETSIEINYAEIGWMLAMSPPGFIVGSLATRLVADRLGRRGTILLSACPIAVGTIVVAFALKPWLLYVTRFLWGVGTGIIGTLVPMYLGEISDSEVRATLSLFTRVTFNLGSLLVMSIGMFVSYECLNYMLLVLPMTYFVACFWIPESPYYLLKVGRVAAAKKVLMGLRQCKDEKSLEDELERMQSHVRNETRRDGSFRELITGQEYRRAVVIGTGLKIAQVMTGNIAVQQYLSTIIQESNISMQVSTAVIVFGSVRFVVGIMSSILVDQVGRRPLLIYSLLGTGVSLAAVSIYFFLKEVIGVHEQLSPYAFIPFAGIISSTVLSTLGYNSIIFVIPGEIYPLNVKAVAMSSLSIFGGVCGFIVAKGFQVIQDLAGFSGVFCVFAVVAFAGTLFVVLCVPETKGKSLKEIQVLLQGDLYYDDEAEKVNEIKDAVNNESENELQELNLKGNNCKV